MIESFKVDKIILFDIDYTLINTDLIKENVLTYLCTKFNVEKKTATESRSAYIRDLDSSSDIDHDKLIKHFSTKFGPRVKLPDNDFYKSSKVFGNTTYTDVRPALSKLSSGFRLGIYSEGFRKFQMAKLQMNDLLNFFDPDLIIIERRKLDIKVVRSLPLGCTIVDDKLEIVEQFSISPALYPIWLNRRSQQELEHSSMIKSLSDLYKLLGNNAQD